MVLDKDQANKMIYQLDYKRFLKEVIQKKKRFAYYCKNDPETLRVIMEQWCKMFLNQQKK